MRALAKAEINPTEVVQNGNDIEVDVGEEEEEEEEEEPT